jgi:hypothetical protein
MAALIADEETRLEAALSAARNAQGLDQPRKAVSSSSKELSRSKRKFCRARERRSSWARSVLASTREARGWARIVVLGMGQLLVWR